ncbi:MAG: hypothetical protein IT533_04470 [Hyphomicrobiales bacterium]|nr:hypothetical protein [Hyphomicrobiales bacterium]
MLRNTQASGAIAPGAPWTSAMKRLAVLCCLMPLGACASGLDMSKVRVDDTLKTNATGSQSVPDQTRVADSVTIRNAVSAADIEALSGAPLAWANPGTGSRGTITGVSETKAAGMLCRNFTATREAYDGVALYRGETCLGDQGAWHMRKFGPL